MCNLSQGIEEKGIAIGEAIGEAKIEQIILNMYRQGFCTEQIVSVTDKTAEEIEAILERQGFVQNQ